MKKLMTVATVLGIALALQSFTNNRTNITIDYNEIDNKEIELIADVGSFETAEESHYDGDKGTWQYRYKKWTLSFTEASVSEVETIISRN